jgi:hypothetical protein
MSQTITSREILEKKAKKHDQAYCFRLDNRHCCYSLFGLLMNESSTYKHFLEIGNEA